MMERRIRPKKLLLLSSYSHPAKDVIVATLAWMCKAHGVAFDAYYASADIDIVEGGGGHHQAHQAGALFSVHGSTVLGGRHYEAIARALAAFDITVVKLDDVQIFGNLLHASAVPVIQASGSLVELYEHCAQLLGSEIPRQVVAIQSEGLPAGLRYGIAQYAFPEAVYRQALALPLELMEEDVARLNQLGVTDAWVVKTEGADLTCWQQHDFKLAEADTLEQDDTYTSFTFRIAEKWVAQARGYDLCEPVLASYWLPFSVQEDRLQVCGETMRETVNKLAPLVQVKQDRVVYGRYAGGVICGAVDDEELFGFFENDIAYQVVEPRRPVLRVFSRDPKPLPQPSRTPFDHEPTDDDLHVWASQGKILTSLIFHSGELSHDDAMLNIMDLCALTKVKIGMPVHVQRYTFNPDCIEPMHTPVTEGGVLGLCEPVLHSSGYGILAESLASPGGVAAMMREARDEMAALAGEGFAPKGIYCYMDANPKNWQVRPEALWKAIAEAGFDYVISSVSPGDNRVLFRKGDFVVLNLGGFKFYPFSPFVRVNSPAQMAHMERQLSTSGKPGWLFGVIDSPIYAYSSYLGLGESLPSIRKPHIYRDARLGSFFDYIRNQGEMQNLVSATPRTIARYARIIEDSDY